MLCNSEIKHDVKVSRVFYSILLLFYMAVQFGVALPVFSEDFGTTTTALIQDSTNASSNENLYIIKALVYEIGILTDTNDTYDEVTERQDVKISFYNPPNESSTP